MSFRVYILQSKSTARYYCGSTSDVERRLKQHNDPEYKGSKTTKRFAGPWALIWNEEHTTRGEAMKREKFLKRGQGREWIKEHIIGKTLKRLVYNLH